MNAEDAQNLAGEYVLGTLSAPERAAFERALSRDPALQGMVQAWEAKLAPLASAAAPEEPGPGVWRAIEATLPPVRLEPVASPAEPQDLRATSPLGGPAPTGEASPAEAALDLRAFPEQALAPPSLTDVFAMRRSLRRWRIATAAFGALAAALAFAAALERNLLGADFPGASLFRGQRATAGQFVAAVNRGGDQPALIVRVDLAGGVVTVRPVAAETPAGKSLELWSVVEGRAPKSLGLVGQAALKLPAPTVFGGAKPEATSFAVTVEPPGGSTTGGPTGPVVYSGKLIAE
jgi:anti-sigma-K factor RskA